MQTQSIQNTLLNTTPPAAPKNAPSGDLDFKQALARQVERQPLQQPIKQPLPQAPVNKSAAPVKAPPPQHAPAPGPQNKTAAPPPKQPAPAAKPAQAADHANAADATDQAAGTAKAAEATDSATADTAVAETAVPADAAAAEAAAQAAAAADAAAVDPMANMLAMIAAYNQQTRSAPGPAEEIATGGGAAAGQADGDDVLAALQGDGGKAGAKLGDNPTAAGKAGAVALPEGDGETFNAGKLELAAGAAKTELKAEAFAAKLADATTAAQPVLPQATQAVLATAQAAEAAASNQLQARVGTNAWEQQLGQKVVWMVAGGDQSASLTLNPPDLGPLQIVLNVSNDQATVSFMAAEAETRQALEDAMPKLRETMSEAGIELGSATVSTGTQDQRQAFAGQAEARAAAGMRRSGNEAGGNAEPATPEPVVRRTVLGAVDTFA
ncbi:flagellar hook-length control protein FliK [Pseudoduganella chitinolytica]|uniref:Flagellar hook-length control protein FliK n=1 Tax=Pseudoduganella chitinolytica TaxID=34070 RepID=A0ABY8BBE0_9BURK|nr:flagellar hook-length control protein FliK [Pseudoduganella chitinolytica]WEF33225.1 flagellar hook-length control protein FliK [Pseudoduganella chitinolytica]